MFTATWGRDWGCPLLLGLAAGFGLQLVVEGGLWQGP